MKFTLIIVTVLVGTLSGCASIMGPTKARITQKELQNYKLDCRYEAEQKRFLESQLVTEDEIFKINFSQLVFESPISQALSTNEVRAYKDWVGSGNINRELNTYIEELRHKCSLERVIAATKKGEMRPVPNPSRCLTLDEASKGGVSVGRQCTYNDGTTQNRWEVLTK